MAHKRTHLHLPANAGEAVADKVAGGMGSWRYIILQSTVVVLWIALNSVAWFVWKWDAPPFILLNLIFSTQASYAAPIIMMSQNRQSARDRLRDDLEAQEVADILRNHQELLEINRTLLTLQQQQMETLALLRKQQKGKA